MSATTVASSNGASSQLAQDVAKFQAIEREINQEVIESRDLVRMIVLAVLSKTHVFVCGEGGVGKSFAGERLMARMPGKTYRTQFSKDMTRDELYGPPDIAALTNADGKGVRMERDVTNMAPEANLIVADEFSDAGTMIARSLLSPLNERIMRDGRQVRKLPLWSFYATGNFWIEDPALHALFDRLAQRYKQPAVTTSEGAKAILRGGIERRANNGAQPSVSLTQLADDELARLHLAVDTAVVPEDILTMVVTTRMKAEKEGVPVSWRRMQEGLKLAQALAVLNGRSTVTDEDLVVLRYVMPNHPDDFVTAAQLTVEFIGKVAQALEGLRGSYAEPHVKVKAMREEVAAAEKAPDRVERMRAVVANVGEISDSLKVVKLETQAKIEGFTGEGRDVTELNALLRSIESDQDFLYELIFGGRRV